MRKSREEAAQTRKRIVTAASEEFRKNGIVATGLNDLMSTAGLTHGGFYKHFESKDQLVAEACAEAVKTILEMLAAAASQKGGCGCVPLDRSPRQSSHRMPAVRDRQRTCPKRREDPRGGDGRLPEARRDHGRAVRQDPAGYRQTACPGRGIDDDWCADHVADRDRPEVVGGDSQGGRDELGRWLTSSARGESSGLFRASV